jgi:hypothetical protein
MPKVFTLSAGTHQLIVRGREGGTQAQSWTFEAARGNTVPDAGTDSGTDAARPDAGPIDADPSDSGGSRLDAGGTTYYVTASGGSDSNPGTSAASPWLTLRNSIPKLHPGDTLIMTGTFAEPIPCGGCSNQFSVSGTATNPIILHGQNAVLDIRYASGDFGNYMFNGSYLVLDGLDITSSVPAIWFGGAFTFNGDHITLQNSTFHDMAGGVATPSNGAGGSDKLYVITNAGNYNTFSNVTFRSIQDGDLYRMWGHDNVITHNAIVNCTNPGYDANGIGQLHADLIQFWGGPDCTWPSYNNVFENSVFTGSTISGGMLASYSSSNTSCTNMGNWTYRNNVFVGTGWKQAIQVAADRMHIYNNVFYNWTNAIDIFATNFGNQMIYDNVFVNSGVDDSYGAPNASSIGGNAWDAAAQSACSRDMRTQLGSNTLLVADPGFVNAAAGDFHLLSTSVLRGRGVNLTSDPFASTTDKDGRTRPTTGAWDVGPYQFVP